MWGRCHRSDFCIDVAVVEASTDSQQVALVDFVSGNGHEHGPASTSSPSYPNITRVSWDVMRAGGLRFCANSCNKDAAFNTRNSINCYTKNDGSLVCPGSNFWSFGNATGDIYDFSGSEHGDGKRSSGNEVGFASSSEIDDHGTDVAGSIIDSSIAETSKDGEEDNDINTKPWWFWVVLTGALGLVAGVIVLLVTIRKKHTYASQGDKLAETLEMGHRRFISTSSKGSRGQYWVPPPPSKGEIEENLFKIRKRRN